MGHEEGNDRCGSSAAAAAAADIQMIVADECITESRPAEHRTVLQLSFLLGGSCCSMFPRSRLYCCFQELA